MAALVCEICGGKLVAKAGGLFECEYCGMQYDKLRIQEMVQEIKGTVKVEGTVEVTGTVKVDTNTDKENLLKRIKICAEDKAFGKIKELSEELLKLDPECAEAYLWQIAAKFGCVSTEELFHLVPENLKKIQGSAEWKNALRYSDAEQAASMDQRMNEAVNYWEKPDPNLKKRFEQIKPVQNLLFSCGKSLIGLQADGTVRVTYAPEEDWVAPVAEWTGVKKLFADGIYSYVLALCWDGQILGVYKGKESGAIVRQVKSWESTNEEKIVDMVADGSVVAALFDDGELCCTKERYGEDGTFYFGYACDWEDVESLSIIHHTASNIYGDFFGKSVFCELKTVMIVGITKDGHVRCSASCFNLDEIPRMAVELGVPWWERKEGVAKINERNRHLLYRDGSIEAYASRDKNKKWLDFDISDRGRITATDLSISGEFRERNLLSYYENFALRADGTILRASQAKETQYSATINDWTNIVALKGFYLDSYCMLGIQEDGRVVIAWERDPISTISVNDWKLFNSLDTFEAERAKTKQRVLQEAEEKRKKLEEERRKKQEEARRKQEEAQKIISERRKAGLCQYCGGQLKGLFSKKCVNCGKPKDY